MIFNSDYDVLHPRKFRSASKQLSSELYATEIGFNKVPPDLRQFLKRDVYILHYCINGKGVFQGEEFKKGDIYLVVPNQSEVIYSDKSVPYICYWIMFKGSYAKELLKLCSLPHKNCVLKFDKTLECAEILKKALEHNCDNEWEEAAIMNAALYEVLSRHIKNAQISDISEGTAQKVAKFLKDNYYRDLSINDIANQFNISQNHLCRIFKNEFSVTPSEFLIQTRLQKAKQMLMNSGTDTLIKTVAISVGFNDPLYFSRVFKKRYKVSPKEFMLNNMRL